MLRALVQGELDSRDKYGQTLHQEQQILEARRIKETPTAVEASVHDVGLEALEQEIHESAHWRKVDTDA